MKLGFDFRSYANIATGYYNLVPKKACTSNGCTMGLYYFWLLHIYWALLFISTNNSTKNILFGGSDYNDFNCGGQVIY